jgi:fluoride exporter
MQAYLAVAIGGTLGCWARYAMTLLIQRLCGVAFPYATLTVNVLGSFLMGFLFYEMLERLGIGPYGRLAVLTGFLGGFTTFSTFSIEALALAQRGNAGLSALYVILSVGLGLLAVYAGAHLARHL